MTAYTILAVLSSAASLSAGLLMESSSSSSATSQQSCPIERSCQESNNSFLPCPVGFICSNSVCSEINKSGQLSTILKYPDINYTLTAQILDCYCMTYDRDEISLTVGACSYNCNPGQRMYVPLGQNYTLLNELMCGCKHHNRHDTMCSKCIKDHCPTLYTYDSTCSKCNSTHWSIISHTLQYIAIAYLPLVLLTVAVFLLKFNIASSHIHGFVLFSQIISIPAVIRVLMDKQINSIVHDIIRVFSVVLGLSNLDFFRAYAKSICMPNISIFKILILDYITAGLPLFFIGVSFLVMKLYERNYRVVVYAWYPFQLLLLHIRQNWDIRSTIADAYCTFFLLSFMKFLSVSFDFIICTKVYVVLANGTISSHLRLFYDASIDYFGPEHCPYAVIAIIILVVFILCPILILLLYQWSWFQKCLFFFPQIFHETVTRFQECYKDGKEGTRDHRWFSGMFLLLRVVIFISFTATPTYLYFVLSAIYILIFSLIMLLVQPFKKERSHYLSVNLFFTTLLCLVYISLAGLKIATVKSMKHIQICYYLSAFFTSTSLFYILGYTVYWLYTRSRSKLKWKIPRKIFTRQKTYGTTDQEEIEGSFPDRIQNPDAYENIMGSVVAHERPKKSKDH